MATIRPTRRYLATAGDINPAEHGGGYLIRVHPGTTYPGDKRQPSYVSLYIVQWDSDDDNASGSLYEADLRDRDVVKAHDWIDVNAVCDSIGEDPAEWRRRARGTYRERAGCIQDIAGYYGWDNLDNYPIRVTREDIRKRWARAGQGPNGWRMPGC